MTKNRCRLVCVKFRLNRCRFAVAVAKCLAGSLFWDTVYLAYDYAVVFCLPVTTLMHTVIHLVEYHRKHFVVLSYKIFLSVKA